MIIAVTYADGQIFQHFGHTQAFKLYEVEDGTVFAARIVETNGSGHGALAGFLTENKVDVLICGGIGGGAQMALADAGIRLFGGAQMALADAGIRLFGGVSGEADDAVEALLAGELTYNPCVRCDHYGGEGHSCGDHGCGSHSCHNG